MKSKKANPPFPTFSVEYDHFIDNNFTLDLNSAHDDTNEIINISTKITNKIILQLLEEKKVKLMCRVICPQTRFRKHFEVADLEKFQATIKIPAEEIIGDLSVMLQIVAVEDFGITGDENFKKIYQGRNFKYETCNIVGYSNVEERTVIKETEEEKGVKSICTITKDNSINHKQYDLEQNKIVIILPKNDYDNLILSNGMLTRTKQALFVENAITYAIDTIKRNEDIETFEYSWLDSLLFACQKAGYKNFNDENFKNDPSYIIAQKILENPSSDAIKEIALLAEDK